MHRQVVNTGCGDDDFFLVGAAALYGQRKLGWRAATLPSSTELMYIFFAVDSMCLLPASGLLSPAFAPARRAHPATGRPVLSPLSPGAARHVAAAVRSRPALSSISWPRAFERCKQRFQAKNFGACGGPRAIVEAAGWRCRRHRVWLSYRVWGYFSGVRCGWSGRKWSIFFLLQKWIDLDELNPMVWVPSIVRRRIDFSLAVFKLRALRAVHR